MSDRGAAVLASQDPDDIAVAKETLESAGYRIYVTSDRKETMDRLQETPPALVLLDTGLGTADAFDLGKSIRTDTPFERSPAIVFMAAERGPETVRRAIAAGGNFLVAKPLKADSLMAGIEKALRHHASTLKNAPAPQAAEASKAGAATGGGMLLGRNVLHVDDELLMRKLVRSVLENTGFKVASACTGEEAIRYLRSHRPNIILLDVCIGEEDGFTLCRQIRTVFPHLDAPVAFLTANRSTEDVQECREVRGDYFILKPFTAETLTTGIKKAFILRRKAAPGNVP